MTSQNEKDVEEGYCGSCRWWTADPLTLGMLVDGEHLTGCDRPECLGCRIDVDKVLPI